MGRTGRHRVKDLCRQRCTGLYLPLWLCSRQRRSGNGCHWCRTRRLRSPTSFTISNARRGVAETTTTDEEVAHILNTYWANFAKTGNPNGEGLPLWPGYDTEEEILDIQPDGQIVGKSDTRRARRLDVIEKATECRTRIQSRGGI